MASRSRFQARTGGSESVIFCPLVSTCIDYVDNVMMGISHEWNCVWCRGSDQPLGTEGIVCSLHNALSEPIAVQDATRRVPMLRDTLETIHFINALLRSAPLAFLTTLRKRTISKYPSQICHRDRYMPNSVYRTLRIVDLT